MSGTLLLSLGFQEPTAQLHFSIERRCFCSFSWCSRKLWREHSCVQCLKRQPCLGFWLGFRFHPWLWLTRCQAHLLRSSDGRLPLAPATLPPLRKRISCWLVSRVHHQSSHQSNSGWLSAWWKIDPLPWLSTRTCLHHYLTNLVARATATQLQLMLEQL